MSTAEVYTERQLERKTRDELDEITAALRLGEIEGTGPGGKVANADVIRAILAAQPADEPVESRALPLNRTDPPGAVPINQHTRRDDGDVLPGHFGRIENGPHAGRVGTYESTVSIDDDGYPEVVLVQLRDTRALVTVDYADLTPTQFGGR